MDVSSAVTALKWALGDFLDRGRPDGVFHVQPGGPGSVPALADLDVPELHLDLLPGVPTATQLEGLSGLGYVSELESRWLHPGGRRLVLCDHGSGWRAAQGALRALLRADPAAAREYRRVFAGQGRAAADEALRAPATAHHARTVGLSPARFVARALAALDAPWMIAGGVALDLHLGHVARPHDDLDVAVPREAQGALPGLLAGWRLDASVGGVYQGFTVPLAPPVYQIHARHPALPDVLMLDLMLGDLSGGLWRYRRDPALTAPLEQARRITPDGLPYLAPEIVLLFKAGSTDGHDPRGKDEQDFSRAAPTLNREARDWLRAALERTRPGHRWLEEL
ncbi:nucleotidyltransferase domain-containing protein [Deinococcus koreensis]|uniref:Uncharacterized protein n=1 Tax=Deinococcus koreensis TaxID=2054903 RepID=A0A2K3V2A5_9DEIO|nr:hypothetical protein [Deinococcus koreensis]PNY82914.1 hypothetical protein CVO96_07295 [Deinococcus koreensis]